MSNDSHNDGIDKVLKLLQKIVIELSEMKKEVITLNNTLTAMTTAQQPMLKSKKDQLTLKASYKTLDLIKQFEANHQRGVTAEELSKISGLARPTIYVHLGELEEADLITNKRGSLIDCSPYNARFYYLKERDPTQTLWDQNLFSSLSQELQLIAKKLLISHSTDENGLSFSDIKNSVPLEVEKIENGLKTLLRRALIETAQIKLETYYYVPSVE